MPVNHNPHPFSAALLRWYAVHGRELPWRGSDDPYAIWVSEIILQQTRIEQGRDYWFRFMRQFPSVHHLAKAREDEVLRLWQGLGYYSRARNMLTAARQIDTLGHFPCTYGELKQLKGVGDYTAAAIASLAFHLPHAVVDGNVYRLLSRHFGIDTPINSTEGKREFTQLAQSLLPADHAADFNQAMMDMGAMVCTPQSPKCTQCPIAESCEALRKNLIQRLPVKKTTTTVKTRRFSYIYIRHEGHTAIHRRPAGDIWQGLWEPLLVEEDSALPLLGCPLQLLKQGVKHVLTHRIILADFYLAEPAERPSLPDDYRWIDENDIDRYALPRLVEKLLQALYPAED